jgi:hypothetical protein
MKFLWKKSRYFICAVLFFFLFSCGYAFVSLKDEIPRNVRTVYIPSFENLTDEPELGFLLASYLSEKFMASGALLPEKKERADAELTGVIESISYSNRVYDKDDDVYLVQVKLSIRVELKEIGGGVIRTIEHHTRTNEYRLGMTGAILDINKDPALDALAGEIAQEIHDRIVLGY